jgi:4-hydroxy-tetrahydrodipicolinate reductase
MPTLALVGYGKMGRLIEQLAPTFQFDVSLRLSSSENQAGQGITASRFQGVDVAIEFSRPETATENLLKLAELGIPTVTGTTGWLQSLTAVSDAFSASQTGFLWSPNFSVGIAVFRKLVAEAAQLVSSQQSYGAWAWELHHDAKKDAPSGTLLHLVDAMKQAGYHRAIDVSSSRAGRVPGTHEIGFDSAADTITLRHTARSREGFATGALQAAKWLIGRQGIYTFEDVLFGQ